MSEKKIDKRIFDVGVIVYDRTWQEIEEQDWPDLEGAVFLLKYHSSEQYGIYQWREEEHESVHRLGTFSDKYDALLFGHAKLEDMQKKLEALEFYADEQNWQYGNEIADDDTEKADETRPGFVRFIAGKRARAVSAEILRLLNGGAE
jgi:hypothetical protein